MLLWARRPFPPCCWAPRPLGREAEIFCCGFRARLGLRHSHTPHPRQPRSEGQQLQACAQPALSVCPPGPEGRPSACVQRGAILLGCWGLVFSQGSPHPGLLQLSSCIGGCSIHTAQACQALSSGPRGCRWSWRTCPYCEWPQCQRCARLGRVHRHLHLEEQQGRLGVPH